MITLIEISYILIIKLCHLLSKVKLKTISNLLLSVVARKEIKIELEINGWYIQFERSQSWVTHMEKGDSKTWWIPKKKCYPHNKWGVLKFLIINSITDKLTITIKANFLNLISIKFCADLRTNRTQTLFYSLLFH